MNPKLENQIIYSIYVRNHTKEGTFQSIEKDLDRIRSLGVDILWFLPIHPIGNKGKKGSLGCPYSIQDYRKVNPDYGTLEDFKHLVNEIHKRNMKCIIDVVYNLRQKTPTLEIRNYSCGSDTFPYHINSIPCCLSCVCYAFRS